MGNLRGVFHVEGGERRGDAEGVVGVGREVVGASLLPFGVVGRFRGPAARLRIRVPSSVCDILSGVRNSSSSISPGWVGGLFFGSRRSRHRSGLVLSIRSISDTGR